MLTYIHTNHLHIICTHAYTLLILITPIHSKPLIRILTICTYIPILHYHTLIHTYTHSSFTTLHIIHYTYMYIIHISTSLPLLTYLLYIWHTSHITFIITCILYFQYIYSLYVNIYLLPASMDMCMFPHRRTYSSSIPPHPYIYTHIYTHKHTFINIYI